MAKTHDAFLSYSHQADGELAAAIENGLERLAKPLLRLRAMDVFRDQTSLTASPALWPSILEHLSASRWFILLACPASAQSPWCVKEVTWWLENRSLETLLVVATGGELNWNPAASDFDWTSTTALSKSLTGKVPEEPLYVDLRWAAGRQKNVTQDSRFREEIVSLAAPIRGMARDELDSADKRQLLRNRALVHGLQGGLGIVTICALATAAYAIVQKRQAISEAVLAKAQAHASQALLNIRTTPMVALGSAIAATDLSATYPAPGALESVVLWAMRVDPLAPRPPPEADVVLRQSLALSRLRAVFEAPTGTHVSQVDGSSENSIAIVRMSDNSVMVLDVTSESVIARREPGKESVASAFLMSSGKHVMVVGKGGSVTVWEFGVDNAHIAASLPPDESQAFAVTPQRDFVVRHGKTSTWLVDLKDGKVMQAKLCRGMNSLRGAVSVAGTVWSIHEGLKRKGLEMCDVRSGHAKGSIKVDAGDITDVEVSPDGRYLATASMSDETVRIWELKTGSEREVFRGHTAVPMRLAFSADSQRLAVGIADGNVSSWRLRRNASRADQQDQIFLATGGDGSTDHIQELDGGKRILTAHGSAGGQQYLRLWAGPMDVEVTRIDGPSDVHSAMIERNASRAWLITAESLASSGFDGKRQVVLGRQSARPIKTGGFTNDGRYAFATDGEGGVQMWSIENSSRSHYWETGKPIVDAQLIGECCLLAMLHEHGELAIYDLSHPGKAVETLQFGGEAGLVRFGGGSDRLLLKRRDATEIYVSKQRTRLLDSGIRVPTRGPAFTAGGRSVLSLSEFDTRLLDTTDAKSDHVLSGHASGIRDGEVSPDGSRVATGSSDWTARIWDAASGAQIAVLRGHSDEVTQVKFRHDGRLIATAGRDGTIRVWNTIGGDQLFRIELGFDTKFKILAFENEYLLVGLGNKLSLYRCIACQQSAELVREARGRMKAGIPREFAPRHVSDRAR